MTCPIVWCVLHLSSFEKATLAARVKSTCYKNSPPQKHLHCAYAVAGTIRNQKNTNVAEMHSYGRLGSVWRAVNSKLMVDVAAVDMCRLEKSPQDNTGNRLLYSFINKRYKGSVCYKTA